MKANWWAISLAICVLVMGFFQFQTCNKKPNTVDIQRDHAVDSMHRKGVADSMAWHKERDSLKSVNATLMADKSEANDMVDMYLKKLEGKDVLVNSWADSVKTARVKKDTAANLAACDSLSNEYTKIRQIAVWYVRANDTLRKVNDSIISFKNGIINRLDGLYSDANNSLFETSRLYGNQSVELKKAQKQAARRFGIGPIIGVGIANGKVGPCIGIGVTYNLLKF